MSGAGVALLMLLASLGVALGGLWQLNAGGARVTAVLRHGRVVIGESRAVTVRRTLDTWARRTAPGAAIGARLDAALVDLPVADFVGLSLALALGAGLAAGSVLPSWMALLIGVAAGSLGWAYLGRRSDQRREAFVGQLPEVLRILSNGAAAGLALPNCLRVAAEETAEPAASTLRAVVDELALGGSIEQVLRGLAVRMASREVQVMTTTIIVQQRTGGNLVRALRVMAERFDQRRELRREVRTILAATVYPGYLVAAAGVGALVLMESVNGGTLDRMATSPIGVAVLLGAAAVYATGITLMNRAARVDS